VSKAGGPRWIECNIFPPYLGVPSRQFMVERIFPIVTKALARFECQSWHYFFEPEVRLRFYTTERDGLRRFLDSEFGGLLKRKEIRAYVYGKHGDPSARYEGEEEVWGKAEWPLAMAMYHNGAQLAKSLMEIKLPSDRLNYHAQRYVHLLLNQLGYGYSAEASFHSGAYHDALFMVVRGIVADEMNKKVVVPLSYVEEMERRKRKHGKNRVS